MLVLYKLLEEYTKHKMETNKCFADWWIIWGMLLSGLTSSRCRSRLGSSLEQFFLSEVRAPCTWGLFCHRNARLRAQLTPGSRKKYLTMGFTWVLVNPITVSTVLYRWQLLGHPSLFQHDDWHWPCLLPRDLVWSYLKEIWTAESLDVYLHYVTERP